MVYNSARITLLERSRDLASLRVLGFTRGEVAYILIGELALLVVLALPIGSLVGVGLAWLVSTSMATELYRVPVIVSPSTFGLAASIVLVATAGSIFLVQRRLDKLDLIGVLKTAE